jgi:hypothetical protein
MRRLKPALIAAALTAALLPATSDAATPRGTAPDCHFPGTKGYGEFGRIKLFTAPAGDAGRRALYGCLTDVGRAR